MKPIKLRDIREKFKNADDDAEVRITINDVEVKELEIDSWQIQDARIIRTPNVVELTIAR